MGEIKVLSYRESWTKTKSRNNLGLPEYRPIKPINIVPVGNLRFGHRIICRTDLIITTVLCINRDIRTKLFDLPQPLSFLGLIGIRQTYIGTEFQYRSHIPIQVDPPGIPFQVIPFQYSILETHPEGSKIFQSWTSSPHRKLHTVRWSFLWQ